MGSNILHIRYQAGVFFYQIFNSPNCNTAILKREEEGVFMACFWSDKLPLLQIFIQRVSYLLGEIDHNLSSAFAVNLNSVIFKVHIV